jgi:hypothetical protein
LRTVVYKDEDSLSFAQDFRLWSKYGNVRAGRLCGNEAREIVRVDSKFEKAFVDLPTHTHCDSQSLSIPNREQPTMHRLVSDLVVAIVGCSEELEGLLGRADHAYLVGIVDEEAICGKFTKASMLACVLTRVSPCLPDTGDPLGRLHPLHDETWCGKVVKPSVLGMISGAVMGSECRSEMLSE